MFYKTTKHAKFENRKEFGSCSWGVLQQGFFNAGAFIRGKVYRIYPAEDPVMPEHA
jgi:hypothetical protein